MWKAQHVATPAGNACCVVTSSIPASKPIGRVTLNRGVTGPVAAMASSWLLLLLVDQSPRRPAINACSGSRRFIAWGRATKRQTLRPRFTRRDVHESLSIHKADGHCRVIGADPVDLSSVSICGG